MLFFKAAGRIFEYIEQKFTKSSFQAAFREKSIFNVNTKKIVLFKNGCPLQLLLNQLNKEDDTMTKTFTLL